MLRPDEICVAFHWASISRGRRRYLSASGGLGKKTIYGWMLTKTAEHIFTAVKRLLEFKCDGVYHIVLPIEFY
jgi:hypothetical protein